MVLSVNRFFTSGAISKNAQMCAIWCTSFILAQFSNLNSGMWLLYIYVLSGTLKCLRAICPWPVHDWRELDLHFKWYSLRPRPRPHHCQFRWSNTPSDLPLNKRESLDEYPATTCCNVLNCRTHRHCIALVPPAADMVLWVKGEMRRCLRRRTMHWVTEHWATVHWKTVHWATEHLATVHWATEHWATVH